MLPSKYLRRLTVLALFACSAYPQDMIQSGNGQRGAPSKRPDSRPNGYIIQFAKGTSRAARALAAAQAGALVHYNYVGADAIAVTVPNENAVNSLKQIGGVVRVTPDFLVEAAVVRGNAKGGGGRPGGGGNSRRGFCCAKSGRRETGRTGDGG